ncbi:unnamed protein product [Diatraea saccharalis]|uniref:Peptidase C1A papain C-terminal domain-containing protein n=1 Tax=Diatraea saccharalis TaxID=40085 RepID=A0A9N9WHP2_9NEOP|nr:unnamed protein product [Diatraea saccharalis]
MLVLRLSSLLGLILISWAKSVDQLHPLSDEFIKLINSKQKLWTAGRNFHVSTPLSYLKSLAGTLEVNSDDIPEVSYDNFKLVQPPRYFDARHAWPYCPSLYDVRDQGSCGSCWAVSAASAMTDRFCIKNGGRKHFYFSAHDILSCCVRCSNGCVGGILSKAWYYYEKYGVVSGGHYNSSQGCRPYNIPPCQHEGKQSDRPACRNRSSTPKCQNICIDSYTINYTNDKQKNNRRSYKPKDMLGIQWDLFFNGPVTTTFNLYEDFLSYKFGVYKYTVGKLLGRHSVKLIGWGTRDGVDYWIATNSWNTDWGEQGFFQIIRGSDHCGLESGAVVG